MLVISRRLIVDSLIRHAIAWTQKTRQRNVLAVAKVLGTAVASRGLNSTDLAGRVGKPRLVSAKPGHKRLVLCANFWNVPRSCGSDVTVIPLVGTKRVRYIML